MQKQILSLHACFKITQSSHQRTYLKYCTLTSKVYAGVLLWFCPSTILTCNQGVIEVCSGIDCCSWCNGSCHHLCDSELKRRLWEHSSIIRNNPRNGKGWNLPLMYKRRKCTCECHNLSRTRSLHTGLQLSTWNWIFTRITNSRQLVWSWNNLLTPSEYLL